VEARRIEEHLEHNDLPDSCQSVSDRGQSIETVLLKVHSDIVEALDEGSMTALIRLNLSRTFHVIDHPILLNRLDISFGIKGKGCNLGKVVLCRQSSVCFSCG